jgi:HSP20 family molecular chaperone IbpA
MIRELGESVGDAIVESVGRAYGRTQEQRPLPADLLESEDAYLAVFDAPGAEPGDVQVRFEDGTVLARVDRFREFHEGFEMRFPGRGLTLEGSVDLPAEAAVDAEGASATLKDNGTLQVEIPKVEDSVNDDQSHDAGATDDMAAADESADETIEDESTAEATDESADDDEVSDEDESADDA